MSDWTKYGSYVSTMPLVKRVQVRLTAAQIAEEIFLYTQRTLALTGMATLPNGATIRHDPPPMDFGIIKHLKDKGNQPHDPR